ncbi:unnamed protein product [Bemisia tabaci]|uniref:Peptidyl-prolyl cis-trans isomerase n=1 Tax=Bemisia tabaci TaxID=7038 RepID=A0A9P0AJ20_BEMTA|nr:unnamed protein product [Bemisia tabaci]
MFLLFCVCILHQTHGLSVPLDYGSSFPSSLHFQPLEAFLEEDPITKPPRPMFNVTHKIFMDFKQGDKDLGRIIFGLFGEVAPKTVENFRTIATVGINGKTYAGTNIYRIVNKFLFLGGDIVNNDGTGDTSIYGGTFPDETHVVQFWAPGFLAMYNHGKNKNGCQFFVTCMATTWLSDVYTGFGKVLFGLRTVVMIEKTEANRQGQPLVPITIVKCGELPLDTPVSAISQGSLNRSKVNANPIK